MQGSKIKGLISSVKDSKSRSNNMIINDEEILKMKNMQNNHYA